MYKLSFAWRELLQSIRLDITIHHTTLKCYENQIVPKWLVPKPLWTPFRSRSVSTHRERIYHGNHIDVEWLLCPQSCHNDVCPASRISWEANLAPSLVQAKQSGPITSRPIQIIVPLARLHGYLKATRPASKNRNAVLPHADLQQLIIHKQ